MCVSSRFAGSAHRWYDYVNKKYVDVDEAKAVKELTDGLFFGGDIRSAIEEFNAKETKEALIARDADQIAPYLQLKDAVSGKINIRKSG